jgi:alkanesulfonate monooxygenase SsuD/methylene tetrahydromethanopterin reductase-like flavin-dependent oxidoreductase (luciferase family)
MRPFSDWMRAAETVCTTLARAGFRYIVFTHRYQYGGMQPLVTMARLAPAADPLRMATQVLLLPLLNAADVAYNVVTFDHICAGRLDLGIGLAYHLQEVPLGGITRQERVPKFVEALAVMKQCWTRGGTFASRGPAWACDPINSRIPRSGSRRIAMGGRTCRAARGWADHRPPSQPSGCPGTCTDVSAHVAARPQRPPTRVRGVASDPDWSIGSSNGIVAPAPRARNP